MTVRLMTVCALWISMLFVGVAAAQRDDARAVGDLLMDIDTRNAVISTTVDAHVYFGEPLEPRDEWVGNLHKVERQRWVTHGNRYRVELFDNPKGDVGNGATRDAVIMWDGGKLFRIDRDGNQVVIDPREPGGVVMDTVALMNQRSGWSFVGSSSLSGMVTRAEIFDHHIEGDSQSFKFYGDPQKMALVEITLRQFNDRWGIDQVHKDTYRLDEAGERVHDGTIIFRVEEWGEYGELILPKRAVRESYTWGRDRAKDMKSRVIFSRISAEDRSKNPPPPDTFGIEPREGMNVTDLGLKVRYTIGGRAVEEGRFQFTTREPIAQFLDSGLADVLDESIPAMIVSQHSLIETVASGLSFHQNKSN